jgi:hypothetical protein
MKRSDAAELTQRFVRSFSKRITYLPIEYSNLPSYLANVKAEDRKYH